MMRRMMTASLPLIVGLALAGCSGPAGGKVQASADITYSGQVEKLFVKNCKGCHGAEKAKGDLILDKGAGYAALVGPMSTKAPDVPRVKPGDPEGSFLWRKLEGTAREGKPMPLSPYGWKKLPDEDLAMVRTWIASGAKP